MTPKKLFATGGTLLSAGAAAVAAGFYGGGGIVCFAGIAATALALDMRARHKRMGR